MVNRLKIVKRGAGKFLHYHNDLPETQFSISDFEVSIDGKYFKIVEIDGSTRFSYLVENTTFIDQTGHGVSETFTSPTALEDRLRQVLYTPYLSSGNGNYDPSLNKYIKVLYVKQMSGGLFNASFINNPVFTDRFISPGYLYSDIITNSAVFDFKIIFDEKRLVSKFLKMCGQYLSDDIKTCNIHAITNIAHATDGPHDNVMSNFPIIFNNHTGTDAAFPTSTGFDFHYYLNNQALITYSIQAPVECYGVRIIAKSNMGNTARYAITKFLFS